MTLGQFFLGLVTLLVATVVYRWQKSVDQKTVVLADLREALSRYAALSHSLFLRQPYIGDDNNEQKLADFFSISDAEIDLYALRDQIYITAPSEIVDAVLDCDRAFRDWKISFPKSTEVSDEKKLEVEKTSAEFRLKHRQMLIIFRSEFESHVKFFGQGYIEYTVSRLVRSHK